MTIPILYEDEYLLLCAKPAGVVSEPDRGRGMPELLSARLREAGKADFILIEQIRRREVEKEYLAVLRGSPDAPEGTLEDLLFHDSRCNKTFVVDRMRKGVREAKLSYRTVAALDDGGQTLTLARVRLHTGRTHQIRVQFASRGTPLLGDIRYGSKAACGPALWSYRLHFVHPVTGEAVDCTCPPPKEYPWSLFFPEESQ